ncbi:hypothetical protein CF326_g9873, partial [Tilletia indica]
MGVDFTQPFDVISFPLPVTFSRLARLRHYLSRCKKLAREQNISFPFHLRQLFARVNNAQRRAHRRRSRRFSEFKIELDDPTVPDEVAVERMNTHKLGSSVDGNDRAMLFFLWDAPLGNYQPQKLGVAETAERLAQYGWEPTTTLISAANAFRMRPFSRNQVFNPHHWQEYRDHLTANLAGQDGAVATLTVPTNGQPQAGPSHLLEPATPLPSIAHEDHSQPQHQPEEVSLVSSVSSVTSATPSTVVASGIPTERSSQAAEVDVSDVTMAVADLVLSSPAIEPFESAPDVVKDSTFRASQSELSEVQQGVENAGPCALNSTSSATAESNSPEEGMISHALFQRADRPPCKDKFVREPIELRPRLLPDRTVWVIENPTSDGPLDKMVEYEGVLASNGAVVAG